MPAFLEKKLKAEYGNNKHAIYGTLNKLGYMKGNKETAKGKALDKRNNMTQIHRVKKVPIEVSEHFEREFPTKKGHSYNYYHYEGSKGQRVYGNEVSHKGKFIHNATQASVKDYAKMAKSKALNKKKK